MEDAEETKEEKYRVEILYRMSTIASHLISIRDTLENKDANIEDSIRHFTNSSKLAVNYINEVNK